jgi:hypothetical protein
MEKINTTEIFIDLTVRSMVNPMNKAFYLKSLSIAQVEEFLTGADDGLVDCFWSAFEQAHSALIVKDTIEDHIFFDSPECDNIFCPECKCRDYIFGVSCPNCDYIEC